jgi:hypothetical protein
MNEPVYILGGGRTARLAATLKFSSAKAGSKASTHTLSASSSRKPTRGNSAQIDLAD